MRYKFSKVLNVDYFPLKKFLREMEEISKEQFLDICAGNIDLDLLNSIKEIDFKRIGKNKKGELYLL